MAVKKHAHGEVKVRKQAFRSALIVQSKALERIIKKKNSFSSFHALILGLNNPNYLDKIFNSSKSWDEMLSDLKI